MKTLCERKLVRKGPAVDANFHIVFSLWGGRKPAAPSIKGIGDSLNGLCCSEASLLSFAKTAGFELAMLFASIGSEVRLNSSTVGVAGLFAIPSRPRVTSFLSPQHIAC